MKSVIGFITLVALCVGLFVFGMMWLDSNFDKKKSGNPSEREIFLNEAIEEIKLKKSKEPPSVSKKLWKEIVTNNLFNQEYSEDALKFSLAAAKNKTDEKIVKEMFDMELKKMNPLLFTVKLTPEQEVKAYTLLRDKEYRYVSQYHEIEKISFFNESGLGYIFYIAKVVFRDGDEVIGSTKIFPDLTYVGSNRAKYVTCKEVGVAPHDSTILLYKAEK